MCVRLFEGMLNILTCHVYLKNCLLTLICVHVVQLFKDNFCSFQLCSVFALFCNCLPVAVCLCISVSLYLFSSVTIYL